MLQSAVCLGCLLLGQVGWRPLPEGGIEYIIQINPELLTLLQQGDTFSSDVPPQLRDVRSYRIVWGSGPVPREQPLGTATFRATPESGAEATWATQDGRVAAPGPVASPKAANVRPPAQPGKQAVAAVDPFLAERSSAARTPAPDSPEAKARPHGSVQPSPARSLESLWPAGDEQRGRVAERSADRGGEPPVLEQPPSRTAGNEPKRLPVGSDDRPMSAQWATFVAGVNGNGSSPSGSSSEQHGGPQPSETPKPWWALTLALAVTFTSLGGSCYLGWIAWEYRRRYRAALTQLAQMEVSLPQEAEHSD